MTNTPPQPDPSAPSVRDRILQALTRNRVPGYQFAGHLFIRSFARHSPDESRLILDAGPHCTDERGEVDIAVLGLFADIALASCIRAATDRTMRLATVCLNLHLNGLPATGILSASSTLQGYVHDTSAKQALSRVSLRSDAGEFAFGSGSFMILPSPPGTGLSTPPTAASIASTPALNPADLREDEAQVLRQADQALADEAAGRGSFISRFLGIAPQAEAQGASCLMQNGPHIANRVGHAQGGLVTGLAARTAQTALGDGWRLTGLSAWFIRPGLGPWLRATSAVLHQGRLTAVVRTQVQDSEGRLVLEAVTNHASAPAA